MKNILHTSPLAWDAVVSMMDWVWSPFISRLHLLGAAVVVGVAGAAVVVGVAVVLGAAVVVVLGAAVEVLSLQSPGPLLQVLHACIGSRYSLSRKQEVGDRVSLGKK